ncbi:MAG: hypothetical protein VX346_05330 [Planctomycetota bacterium]|nr:hypothetical protein [Planctomycetota bacterium]
MFEPISAAPRPANELRTAAHSYYTQRCDQCDAEAALRARRDRLLSQTRVVLSVTGLVSGFLTWQFDAGVYAYSLVGGLFVGLLSVATYQEHVRLVWARVRALSEINRECLARLARQWEHIPLPSVTVPTRHKATSDDLDLFGHASLFQWICRCETRSGTTMLRDWLLEPAVPSEILLRHDAIKELAPHAMLREQLLLLGRQLRDSPSGPDRMIEWTESPDWLLRRRWLTWLVRLLPALFVASGLTLFLWESGQPVWLLLCSLLGCHFLLSLLFGGQVHTLFHHVSSGRGEVQNYLELFHLIEQEPAVSSKLVSLQQQATLEHGGIHLRLRQLGAIMVLANLRHSAVTFPLWLVLQLGLLWDFHVLAVLETWKRHHGSQVRSWFAALGEYEALVSLAAVHHDYPDWSFPTIAAAGKPLQARGLGHPLLTDTSRVANDIEIGSPQCCLLVTGSNMSGKSTLLRTTGLNLSLAQMGSPVCASHWKSPPLRVMTSMRVSDSLDQGVSFYFAELQRLKEIVDTVRNRVDPTQPQILFLLDEILQGTNSRERHIAVQQVLSYLLKEGAMGAVSTHDLDLAQIEPLRSACRAVHFRETVEETETGVHMDFDYRLREGIATTTNALELLKIVGLTNLS